MLRAVISLVVGAAMLTAAVAGFIIVPEHAPVAAVAPSYGTFLNADGTFSSSEPGSPARGLSRPVYDGLRIVTWALLIAGALLVAVGLINHARRE